MELSALKYKLLDIFRHYSFFEEAAIRIDYIASKVNLLDLPECLENSYITEKEFENMVVDVYQNFKQSELEFWEFPMRYNSVTMGGIYSAFRFSPEKPSKDASVYLHAAIRVKNEFAIFFVLVDVKNAKKSADNAAKEIALCMRDAVLENIGIPEDTNVWLHDSLKQAQGTATKRQLFRNGGDVSLSAGIWYSKNRLSLFNSGDNQILQISDSSAFPRSAFDDSPINSNEVAYFKSDYVIGKKPVSVSFPPGFTLLACNQALAKNLNVLNYLSRSMNANVTTAKLVEEAQEKLKGLEGECPCVYLINNNYITLKERDSLLNEFLNGFESRNFLLKRALVMYFTHAYVLEDGNKLEQMLHQYLGSGIILPEYTFLILSRRLTSTTPKHLCDLVYNAHLTTIC